MDDRDLEQLLRRYRPADPPSDLRERCLAQAADEPPVRGWPWAAAAAAMLAAATGFATATARLDPLAVVPDERVLAIERLAALLGGDEAARRVAEIIVVEEQPEEMP